ncbi:tetratricopeptide repeat protein [Nitrospirillum bahiense]|nr:hypothetical protein [Nitrospirillum amazonense]
MTDDNHKTKINNNSTKKQKPMNRKNYRVYVKKHKFSASILATIFIFIVTIWPALLGKYIITDITIPESMIKDGFDRHFIARSMMDSILSEERKLNTLLPLTQVNALNPAFPKLTPKIGPISDDIYQIISPILNMIYDKTISINILEKNNEIGFNIRINNILIFSQYEPYRNNTDLTDIINHASAELFNYINPYANIMRLYNMSKFDQAILAANAIIYNPESHKSDIKYAYNLLGNIYLKMNDRYSSKINFEKSISIDSKFSAPYYNLGTIFDDDGNEEKAMEYYKSAAKYDNTYPHPHDRLGDIFAKKGTKEFNNKAEEQYRIAISIAPLDPYAHNNLGNIFFERGDLFSSLDEYMVAIYADPDDKYQYLAAARVLANIAKDEQGDKRKYYVREACQKYAKSIENQDDDGASLFVIESRMPGKNFTLNCSNFSLTE